MMNKFVLGFRFWLIRKIAGKCSIVINVHVDGDIRVMEPAYIQGTYIEGSLYAEGSFYSEGDIFK